MAHGTCSVAGCDKPIRTAPYCYAHYMKNWRYGSPTPQHAPRWRDLTGARFGSLTVTARANGRWVCSCDCGAVTEVRSGDLNRGTVTTCGDPATHRRTGTADYTAAHERVRADRGRVQQYPCVGCGSPAAHWSYDHDDPDERHSARERTLGIAFSLDPAHYSPRCVPCHKRFDLDRIDAARLAPLA